MSFGHQSYIATTARLQFSYFRYVYVFHDSNDMIPWDVKTAMLSTRPSEGDHNKTGNHRLRYRLYAAYPKNKHTIMMSLNGNIFRVTGPLVRGIHRWPVNSPHKGQWRGALMSSLICDWINSWVYNREAGDLRRHHAHYDVIVMSSRFVVFCCGFVASRFCTNIIQDSVPAAGFTIQNNLFGPQILRVSYPIPVVRKA